MRYSPRNVNNFEGFWGKLGRIGPIPGPHCAVSDVNLSVNYVRSKTISPVLLAKLKGNKSIRNKKLSHRRDSARCRCTTCRSPQPKSII